MKKILIAGSIVIALTIIYFLVEDNSLDAELVERETIGIIDSINRIPRRGGVHFLINNEWQDFWVHGYKLDRFAMSGDSLVKEKGKDRVLLYRKNWEGKYVKFKEIRLAVYPLEPLH